MPHRGSCRCTEAACEEGGDFTSPSTSSESATSNTAATYLYNHDSAGTQSTASRARGDQDVEVVERIFLPLAPGARRVCAVLEELVLQLLGDRQAFCEAPPASVLHPQRERGHPRARCQRSAILHARHLFAQQRPPRAAVAVLADQHVADLHLLEHHRRWRDRFGAELHQHLLREDLLVGLQGFDPGDVDEMRLPRLAGPLLHELQLIALEIGDGCEEQLDVLVLELHHLLVRHELEGRLAVCQRQDGALRLPAAPDEEHVLRLRKRLGHVGEALFVLQPLERGLHLPHVAGERQDVQSLGDGAIWHDLAVPELHNPNLHVLVAKVFPLVLLHELDREALYDLEAILLQGATGINGQDEILLRDADLVTGAVVRVALPHPVPILGLSLRALPLPIGRNGHSAPLLRVATAARNGARRPLGPLLELAVRVTTLGIANAWPRLLDRVARQAAVLRRDENASSVTLRALAYTAACAPERPLGHLTVHWALDLVALLFSEQRWAFDAELVGGYNDLAGQGLPAPAPIWVQLVRAGVIATHGALTGDPIRHSTVNNLLGRGHLAVFHGERAHQDVGAVVLVLDPVDPLPACFHIYLVSVIEIAGLLLLLGHLLLGCSDVGHSLIEVRDAGGLLVPRHLNLRVQVVLGLLELKLLLVHVLLELIHLVLVLAPHQRHLVVEEAAIRGTPVATVARAALVGTPTGVRVLLHLLLGNGPGRSRLRRGGRHGRGGRGVVCVLVALIVLVAPPERLLLQKAERSLCLRGLNALEELVDRPAGGW